MNTSYLLMLFKGIFKRTAVNSTAVFFVLFSSAMTSNLTLAQASVRDSSPISTSAPIAANSQSPQGVDYQLITQLQQLQQEVSILRGQLEEQGFEIKRLKQQRLDDYLDLDKRISGLREQQAVNTSPSPNLEILSSAGSLPTTVNEPSAAVDTEAEKVLYRQAIDLLLNKQDYAGAQTNFTQYLNKYPQGTYTPNVYYWQGQIYLTDSNKAEAEKSFSTLISNYPDHQKAPDAKYKLATLYFDQGKKAEAKILLDEVAASNSDASRLAKAFITKQYP